MPIFVGDDRSDEHGFAAVRVIGGWGVKVGSGPTVAAYLLNAWALAHAESSLVAAYAYVQPVLTAILAAMYLNERIRPIVGVAAAMIFAGLYISGKRSARL